MRELPIAASFDGGDLDCGSGLLLLIRRHIDPLEAGQLIEIRSREVSVAEDLPAWCRLTGNELVAQEHAGREGRYVVSKGKFGPVSGAATASVTDSDSGTVTDSGSGSGSVTDSGSGAGSATDSGSGSGSRADSGSGADSDSGSVAGSPRVREPAPITAPVREVVIPAALPVPAPAPAVRPLSVMGVGSWPRPRWLLRALHDHLEGRLDDEGFDEIADDAVRLAVAAQVRAGVDALTDGEQRRDSYSSFVGGRLDNCQLIPITDLLPYVDDPDAFARELRALDVPAAEVRHPAVFGPLGRSRPIAAHEIGLVRSLSPLPIKVALPGPYLLTRTMWMECISDRAYATREALAVDITRVLREEIHALLAAGASIVQIDEPVLSEVAFGRPAAQRTFMCGALGERGRPEDELPFAEDLLRRALDGLPADRLALHVCRGNWTPDERVALAGDYAPLLGVLSRAPVGTVFLELCTERAGDIEVLRGLPEDKRVGVGVVNQKHERVEAADEILARAEAAVRLFGPERVLLNPDCGFATFADNPVASAKTAEAKLAAVAEAARALRDRHHIA